MSRSAELSTPRRALTGLAMFAILAALVPATPSRAVAEDLASQPMIGEAAPSFRLQDLDGAAADLETMRGEYVVIHFATTWCPYCNAEAPSLQKIRDDYRERGVRVLVVDVKEERDLVAAWASRHAWTFPVLLDSDGAVASAFAPDVLPDLPRDEVLIASNLLIDRQGRIQFYSLLDSRRFDARLVALRARLDALLEAE